jgi:hypothetical protein
MDLEFKASAVLEYLSQHLYGANTNIDWRSAPGVHEFIIGRDGSRLRIQLTPYSLLRRNMAELDALAGRIAARVRYGKF